MFQNRLWLKGCLVAFLSFLFSWFLLEEVCGFFLRWRGKNTVSSIINIQKKETSSKNKLMLIRYDSLGISRPAPGSYEIFYPVNLSNLSKEKASTLKMASVVYHIDSLSRRVTPFDTIHAAKKYALFLGCSFTYGESVADTNTLPYFFGKQTNYKPYNYGVSGYSPSHMLALGQIVNFRNEVAEKEGIAIYTYIEDHLARVAPTTKWIYNSDGYLPHVNPNTLKVEGTYAQHYPLRLRLIRNLYKSNIINLFNINYPRRYSLEHYEQFVNMVKKTEQIYHNQFSNDNFYVLIFPTYPMDTELRRLFEKANLKIIDYSNLFIWESAYDKMHPDGNAYRRVAKKLAVDLQLNQTITILNKY